MVGKKTSEICYPKSIKTNKELKDGTLVLNVSYGNQLDRIRNQYGDSVANEIAASVQESYRTGVAPTGLLSGGLPAGTRIDEGPFRRGFINEQGNFQRGTKIGQVNQNNAQRESSGSAKQNKEQSEQKEKQRKGRRSSKVAQ